MTAFALRCLAGATFFAAAPLLAPVALADDPPAVTIHAYAPDGTDTGKCLTSVGGGQEGPGGYVLKKCSIKKNAAQVFLFDTNAGGWISQFNGGASIVLGVRGGKVTDGPGIDNGGVSRVMPSVDQDFQMPWAVTWRWSGGQLMNTDMSLKQATTYCLTAVNDTVMVDECAKKATLIQWDVLLAR